MDKLLDLVEFKRVVSTADKEIISWCSSWHLKTSKLTEEKVIARKPLVFLPQLASWNSMSLMTGVGTFTYSVNIIGDHGFGFYVIFSASNNTLPNASAI